MWCVCKEKEKFTPSEEFKKRIEKPKYLLSAMWVNYMKKHEFNPPHDHDGKLSFVIYLSMWDDMKDNYKGIAVSTAHYKGYFPIAHEGGGNMDRKKVLEWFKDILNATSTKIFHNAMYDVCWIKALGLTINGMIVDTMIAAAVTDEKTQFIKNI